MGQPSVDEQRLMHFRRTLVRQREELAVQGAVSVEEARAEASDTLDDDEQPLTQMNQAIASGRNSARAAQLAAIVRAIERIDCDPEIFGHCIDCEEPLPERRLALMPWVELCLACQDKQERDRPRGRRRATDYR